MTEDLKATFKSCKGDLILLRQHYKELNTFFKSTSKKRHDKFIKAICDLVQKEQQNAKGLEKEIIEEPIKEKEEEGGLIFNRRFRRTFKYSINPKDKTVCYSYRNRRHIIQDFYKN